MNKAIEGSNRDAVFLVVVEGAPEQRVALRYAARRAKQSRARVGLLHVYEPMARHHWGAMETLLRDERREEAEALVAQIAEETTAITGQLPVIYIREGETREELLKLLERDASISTLILAARTADGDPGPLVASLSGKYLGRLHVPLTIVPASLSDAQIDAAA